MKKNAPRILRCRQGRGLSMKKIMIVDDEQISLMMTNHILSTEYHTIIASSGEEAIKLYGEERPDMVLSDLRMPGMSGFDLQKKLTDQYEGPIPFMFMTADHDEEVESQGFANGAQDFIRKPFRADVLLRRIGNILSSAEQIQNLKISASTDPMTGLLNKTSSQEEIGILCNRSQGMLMMIDLDSFKLVNDLYGHEMGDRILIRFAEIIKSAVRSTDLVGRMGGDEFIAFCQNVRDEKVLRKKTEYINTEILKSAKEFMGEDMQIPLGASIGCVIAPDEGRSFTELFKKADKALYTVKQNGKHGCSIYHSEENKPPEDDGHTARDIANIVQILEERNKPSGAFAPPFEIYRAIFQFLRRVNARSEKSVWFLLFTIETIASRAKDIDRVSFEDARDQFFDTLCHTLRQSDVVTQNSINQFMVLLYETELYNIEIVVDRILENWSSAGLDEFYTITYELEKL